MMIQESMILLPFLFIAVAAYGEQWSSAGFGRPELNRHSVAGIWKLTSEPTMPLPMKEFTVYPKTSKAKSNLPELLLMLKEDGSFHQYSSGSSLGRDDDEDDARVDLDSSWNNFQSLRRKKKENKLGDFIKGTWDFLDGNLILAADRPDERTYSSIADGKAGREEENKKPRRTLDEDHKKVEAADTLLRGRVVANYQTSLQDNPALTSDSSKNDTSISTVDTHLSVPKGSINIGKFFYPKKHPSFFEQPMFQPVKTGTVTLRQILGSLNTKQDRDNAYIEKFQRSDFYNRTFLLTTHPIGHRQPKGNTRWSIKYNKFVKDPPSKKAAKAAEEAKKRVVTNIRVMQVAFYANNTFSTTGGLGGAAILRGKFDVIGRDKDQLWMQVIRFGFGRSISGSVYSEGRMLSHEDAKAYWGTINEGKDASNDESHENAIEREDDRPLEVTGSVMDGWGLEPIPVARFILKEVMNTVEEEEDEEEDEEAALEDGIARLDPGFEDDGIDWSDNDEASFQ